MVLFTESRENNFVGGTCAPPSALLVSIFCRTTRMHSADYAVARCLSVHLYVVAMMTLLTDDQLKTCGTSVNRPSHSDGQRTNLPRTRRAWTTASCHRRATTKCIRARGRGRRGKMVVVRPLCGKTTSVMYATACLLTCVGSSLA